MLRYQYWLCCALLALLSACAQQANSPSAKQGNAVSPSSRTDPAERSSNERSNSDYATSQSPRNSERLGTQWGDEVDSRVTQVDMRRISESPIAETSVRYADKRYSGRSVNSISMAAGMVEFALESDSGRRLPLYRDGSQYFLSGEAGQAYRLVYRNNSNATYEIVASVDGLDVLNGSRASRGNNGYVLRPKDTLVIEGFRKSNAAVASFVFSKPQDAYAAHSDNGSINNTGIIGSVVYELYDPSQRQRPVRPRNGDLDAFPADNGYSPSPH